MDLCPILDTKTRTKNIAKIKLNFKYNNSFKKSENILDVNAKWKQCNENCSNALGA